MLSARAQARLVRERHISSRELVAAHLERIAAVNPVLNAAVGVQSESALEDAPAADRELAAGALRGAFHGVPFSIKDSIEQAGTRCTAGTLGRRNAASSTADATLVQRLRNAGAIPIARTNLPDLLFAFESSNLIFGQTNNPYDTTRTSRRQQRGGSRAHCGVRLAAGAGQRRRRFRPLARRLLRNRRPQADLGSLAAHRPLSSRRRLDRVLMADRPNGPPRGRSYRSHAPADRTRWHRSHRSRCAVPRSPGRGIGRLARGGFHR